jgi:hypothetical protein
MKKMLCVMMILGVGLLMAQSEADKSRTVPAETGQAARQNVQGADALQQVNAQLADAKAVLGEWTLHIRALEKRNAELESTIRQLVDLVNEVAKVKDTTGLDAVLKKYGIERKGN